MQTWENIKKLIQEKTLITGLIFARTTQIWAPKTFFIGFTFDRC